MTNNSYIITTQKTWLQTRSEIANEMRLWEVEDWIVDRFGEAGARVSYVKDGHTIDLNMDKQDRAQDNLRVLFLALQAMRLNEKRGIADTIKNAYLQIAAPAREKDPYEVLGLPRGTHLAVCEAQYRELAKQYHPDRGGSPEKIKELNEAIEKLRKGTE